ncbi:glutathione S- transferase, nitrogen catabolite repression regulator [Agyrium rufum]|nr:glutathione S- transferase, nitrogen catabolite repression regulator [Agyrium rufum]
MQSKPIGPNPWKVALIFEELSVPYTVKVWDTQDQKKPPFTTTLNPNGLTPVLEDPNTGVKIYESGAIIDYVLFTYDKEYKVSFPVSDAQNRGLMMQFSFLQATMQGPALSNHFYFVRTDPSNSVAKKRFFDQSMTVLSVLESELQGKEYLVGGKCSAADLVFVPYLQSMSRILGEDSPDLAEKYPLVNTWYEKLLTRESVKAVGEERAKHVPKV